MTNDELSQIDALIAHGQPLPLHLAKLLRDRLAGCAAEAVTLRKRALDGQQRVYDLHCEAESMAWAAGAVCACFASSDSALVATLDERIQRYAKTFGMPRKAAP